MHSSLWIKGQISLGKKGAEMTEATDRLAGRTNSIEQSSITGNSLVPPSPPPTKIAAKKSSRKNDVITTRFTTGFGGSGELLGVGKDCLPWGCLRSWENRGLKAMSWAVFVTSLERCRCRCRCRCREVNGAIVRCPWRVVLTSSCGVVTSWWSLPCAWAPWP